MPSRTRRGAIFVGGEDLTDEVRIATDRADFTGTYSHIFRGTCRGNEVAVKVLKLVSEQLHTMQRKFRREVAVWTHIRHPNISPFYGYTDGSDPFGPVGALISPWYSNGDATKFLRERGQFLSVEDRINLWKGVVSGVCYLHEQDPQIVHGDLKPGNVLIDDTGTPKICDFGLSCIYLDEGHTDLTTTSPYTGTERYLAPELLEDGAQPSTTSDVWALGCIGLQFLHSTHPYQHRQSNRTGLIFQDIRQGVLPASRPTHTDARIQTCWPILVGCWRHLPNLRFDANYVLFSLGYLAEAKVTPYAAGESQFGLSVPTGNSQGTKSVIEQGYRGDVYERDSQDGDSKRVRSRDEQAGPSRNIYEPKSPQEFPGSLSPSSLPASLRKEGPDWFAMYNPRLPGGKSLDISLLHQFNHESIVACVRFSKDGRYLATGCNISTQIFEMKTGQLVCQLRDNGIRTEPEGYIRSVCFSPDGKYLATGGEDRSVRVWDIAKKRIRVHFKGHEQEVYSLDFSSDGNFIVSGSGDETARIWDLETGNSTLLSTRNPPSIQGNSNSRGDDTTMIEAGVDVGVTSVAISPDGQLAAVGHLDAVVRLWDVATGTLLERLRGHRDSVYSVVFTPDGRGVLSASLDKTLKYWELNTAALRALKNGQAIAQEEKYAKFVFDFVGHKDYVLSVAISHDGQRIVSGSKDRGVLFWDKNGVAQLMLQGHQNSVISVDLSPTGLLATSGGDWQARVWQCKPLESPQD